jgi:maltooligosyltrehalose trehalohydrolase
LTLRFDGGERGDRLLLTNFGADRQLDIMPEPLLAPSAHARWELVFSSEDVIYGGQGTPAIDADDTFFLPARCTLYLRACPSGARGATRG